MGSHYVLETGLEPTEASFVYFECGNEESLRVKSENSSQYCGLLVLINYDYS